MPIDDKAMTSDYVGELNTFTAFEMPKMRQFVDTMVIQSNEIPEKEPDANTNEYLASFVDFINDNAIDLMKKAQESEKHTQRLKALFSILDNMSHKSEQRFRQKDLLLSRFDKILSGEVEDTDIRKKLYRSPRASFRLDRSASISVSQKVSTLKPLTVPTFESRNTPQEKHAVSSPLTKAFRTAKRKKRNSRCMLADLNLF